MPRLRRLSNVELGIVVTYIVQKHGEPRTEEIAEKLRELGIAVNGGEQLRDVLKALKSRDILSINSDQYRGEYHDYARMKRITFATLPEAATIKDLLPALWETDVARAIKQAMDAEEVKPDSTETETKKAKERRAKYTDAHIYSALFELGARIYGARMTSDSQASIRENSQYQAKLSNGRKADASKIDLFFDRDMDTGAIVIHSAAVRGWFSTPLPRITKFSDSVGVNHCSFDEALIFPDTHGVRVTTLPVIPAGFSRGGSQPQTYETIMPGETMKVRITAPTRGFMTPEELRGYLEFVGMHAMRHLSPARGSETGKMKLIAFVDHGDVWKDIIGQKTDEDMDDELVAYFEGTSDKPPKSEKTKAKEHQSDLHAALSKAMNKAGNGETAAPA